MFRHGGRPVVRYPGQDDTAARRRLEVEMVAGGRSRGHELHLGMTAEKLRPDPGMDENRDNFRVPRHAADVIGEIDLMTGQTLGEK